MEFIADKSKNHFKQKLPFVLYCKPNSDKVIGFFQENDTLFETADFTEKGFVFASFDGSKTVIIPENKSELIYAAFPKKEIQIQEKKRSFQVEIDKNNFEGLVGKGIQAIKDNQFKKVVLSRKESVDLQNFDLIQAFRDLVQLYPNTFVYCFYHPKVGTWLGATPEQLLKAEDNFFKTIALAGTQKYNGSDDITWPTKEREEQQFVTDYIVDKVQNIASKITVSKPYSIKAGIVWHIKTDISGSLNLGFGLKEVIQLLHPTPAVCGLPKQQAKEFIFENENYNRTFYTGFLGELNVQNQTDLFVNLRCMEIEVASKLAMTKAHLFMGCGITKDSIPEKEWEESINKSATMKRILDVRL
ncbi:isochorismate synthase [Flavobacterium sp.]|uniref:isochorismate synthase n=1 Tax=Flavobacterium sp. TaxID=239 RepID=UPI00286E0793|nr:isochorismate synthase [Flavobacterium sp.]